MLHQPIEDATTTPPKGTSINHNDTNRIFGVAMELLKKTGKADLQSQIDFVDFLNKELMKTPIFFAIISSLKELQAIKRKSNNPHL